MKVAFEPVSQAKSTNLFAPCEIGSTLGIFPRQSVHLSTPKQYELESIRHAAEANGYFNDPCGQDVHDNFSHDEVSDRLSGLAAQHSPNITALQ